MSGTRDNHLGDGLLSVFIVFNKILGDLDVFKPFVLPRTSEAFDRRRSARPAKRTRCLSAIGEQFAADHGAQGKDKGGNRSENKGRHFLRE